MTFNIKSFSKKQRKLEKNLIERLFSLLEGRRKETIWLIHLRFEFDCNKNNIKFDVYLVIHKKKNKVLSIT